MHRPLRILCYAASVLSALAPTRARTQTPTGDLQLADRGPRFLSTPTPSAPAVDVSNAPPFQQRVSLELIRVPLRDALHEISKQTGFRFLAIGEVVPLGRPVSISATDITVGAALFELLTGLGIDVRLSRDLHLATLIAKPGRQTIVSQQPPRATLAGRVTDAITHAPLDQVAVRIEGSGLGAVTASDGRYAIRDVPPGAYHVTARRVGYTPLTKAVTVTVDSIATGDFALVAAPTRLNEMVTTAVGTQRRYEVGNVISTINADSIAPTAPITSLTDLISARAPGVEVLETSGMTGSGEAIRIRGLSSLVLQNDPIVIVDGVRHDNSAGGDIGAYFSVGFGGSNGAHPSPSRLNDIDFSDIESVDLLKGPAASTEYGTDAANGVIVITTKHGSAGRPRWSVSAEQTASEIPARFPDGYYSWGHTTDAAHAPVNCPLISHEGISFPNASTAGTCVVDSVTRWNPLNHAGTSIFGTGNRRKYDLSVSGGGAAMRFFVAGGLSNERGVIQMPSVFRQLADTAKLGLPNTVLNPNSEQQRSARANTAIQLAPTADLTVTGSYLSTYQQTPDAYQLYEGAFFAPALSDASHLYGYDYFGSYGGLTPLGELAAIGSQNTNRLTGGLTASWQPAGWLVSHATGGLDHASQRNAVLNYPLANAAYELYAPFLGLVDEVTDVYSVDLRATATASITRSVRAATSGGLQMADTRLVGQSASTNNITATNVTLNGATGATVAQLANRQATLGGYGEEQISIADRLFLAAALRVDAGSGFGRRYATAAYPKASVSWLALSQSATSVRLRGAFGESGVQPLNGAALRLYTPQIAYLGGTTASTIVLNWPGNPGLKPERSAELEGGVDIAGWGNRLSLELTGYSKTTRDALVNVDLGATLCCYTYQKNIGEVRNRGVEGSATVGLVASRLVTWDVAVNASVNHNTLLTLAPGIAAQTLGGGSVQYRQAPGYPLYGIWAHRVTYADANHDGIIEPNEVTLADSASYVGPSLPTREASVSTHVGLWRGKATLGGLVDFRGGYRILNSMAQAADLVGNTRQANDPTSPLWLQARAVANVGPPFFSALDVEDGSFVRVREVSLTLAAPQAVTRALRLRSASLTGAVRNLALWTHYTGVDPEASNIPSNVQVSPTSGNYMVNGDVRGDFGVVPLLRYWVVRVNAGL